MAWIGFSQGGVMALKTILRHPENQPQLFVSCSGGWVPKLDSFPITNIHCTIHMIHGANGELFPVADCQRLADLLKTNGIAVKVCVIAEAPHDFGIDRPVVLKMIAEHCPNYFSFGNSGIPNIQLTYWYYWLPLALIVFQAIVKKKSSPGTRGSEGSGSVSLFKEMATLGNITGCFTGNG